MKELPLKYGCNPHQVPARVYAKSGDLPIRILNGQPSYINLLDAMNAWQLVQDLKQVLGFPAATSFKHVSPAGAAIGLPLNEVLRRAYFVDDMDLSPLATAYARARGADRMSSYGDFAALSDPVDVSTARLLKREVSDGVIAPDYAPEALEILKQKKKGRYVVIAMDPAYHPPESESREVFGVTFEQKRNDRIIDAELLQNIVTKDKKLDAAGSRDLLVATITLKYTQSNSVCLAHGGQVIGVGAGQQSRVHCTRLACTKADRWFLRQHDKALNLPFKPGVTRPDRINAIELYLEDDVTGAEREAWLRQFESEPVPMSHLERSSWLAQMSNVAISSDGFFPFRDNIDRAGKSGVRYVIQPGGSIKDDEVIAAADSYRMVMVFSKLRLFHH